MRMLTLLMGFVLFTAAANAACITPSGAAGDMTYSTSANVMAYCDGQNWISMAGGVSLTVNTSGGGADNLGNHTATQDLNMSGYSVNSGLNATFTGLGNFGSLLTGGLTVTGQASITTISTTLLQVGSGGGASCSSNINGALRYNSTSSTLEICTGTSWTGLASGTITGSGISGGSATAIAFWNGPNSLTYESATTTGLYWDHPNGRLGVGTNSPSNSLHVIGGAGQGNAMILEANASGGYSGNALQFRRGMAPSTAGWAIGGDVPGSNPTVMTDDLIVSSFSGVLPWVERMRIVSGTGYVGIANGSPTANLQISGTFIVSQTNQNSLASASLAVDSRGVSVSSIIHINGSPGAAMGAGSNQIVSDTTNVTAYSAGSVTITTNGSQRMVIGSNGNVGIAKSQPAQKLDVNGMIAGDSFLSHAFTGSYLGYNIFWNGTGWQYVASDYAGIWRATSGGAMEYWSFPSGTAGSNASTYSAVMSILPSGRVGVNTSNPWAELQVSGTFALSNATGNSGIYTAYTGASGRSYSFSSCKSCNSVGLGGLEIYDATAGAGRAFIAAGVNGWQTPSDRRLKKDIQTLRVLDKLGPVRGVSYKLKDSGKPQIGVIAQEIDQSFPLAVTGKRDGAKFLGVSYDAIAAIALEGVKELKALFDSDHTEVAKLKAANDNLERRVEALETELKRMTARSR